MFKRLLTVSSNLAMLPVFVAPKMRVDRAKHHLANLDFEIAEFKQRNAYGVVSDRDPETGIEVFRIRVYEPIPCKWSILIGEIFHNLRSALDNLAIDLLRVHVGTPSKTAIDSTYFPIGKTKSSFELSLQDRFRRVSPQAIRLVKRLKPYEGGTNAFWTIHRLNILDKHICLLPSAFISDARHSADRFIDMGDGSFASFLNGLKEGIRVNMSRIVDLKDGDEIASALDFQVFQRRDGTVVNHAIPIDGKIEFSFDIAFGKGQVIDGEPVVPSVKRLIYFTERIVSIFERHCS